MAEQVAAVAVEMWRDPGARRLPGGECGSVSPRLPLSSSVPELYRSGKRCFRITEPVKLCADAPASAVHALVLVRELTGLGAAVAWTARCDDGCVRDRRFAHLFPPMAVQGAGEDAADDWRARYLPCMCLFRRGPGFAEVRDRRQGTLEILTLDDRQTLAAIGGLLDGAAVAEVPAEVRGPLTEAGLIAEHAGVAWWLPTRAHRWPNPSMIV